MSVVCCASGARDMSRLEPRAIRPSTAWSGGSQQATARHKRRKVNITEICEQWLSEVWHARFASYWHLCKPVDGVVGLLDAHLGERLRERGNDCIFQVPVGSREGQHNIAALRQGIGWGYSLLDLLAFGARRDGCGMCLGHPASRDDACTSNIR